MGLRKFALYTFFLFVCDLIHFQRLVDCSFETILKRFWNNFERGFLNPCFFAMKFFFSTFSVAKIMKNCDFSECTLCTQM
jgi:hypothetical protein